MRVDNIDEKLIVFLKGIIDDDLEHLCRKTINKLKKYYDIELKGFYNVNIFIDNNYGTILEFSLEDLDLYYDYSKVDLHIIKKEIIFLYQVDDILDFKAKSFYFYKDKYYIPLDSINLKETEFVKLIYNNTNEIINDGHLIIV